MSMSDWEGIRQRIKELQTDLRKPDIDLKQLPHLLDSTLSLLSRVTTSASLQYEEERYKRLMAQSDRQNDRSIETLRREIDALRAPEPRIGAEQKFGAFVAIDRQFAAVNQKLDAILQRLPEPPQGFKE
jgi:chromosome segregation ATPase